MHVQRHRCATPVMIVVEVGRHGLQQATAPGEPSEQPGQVVARGQGSRQLQREGDIRESDPREA